MRAIVQRVSSGQVSVEGQVVGRCGVGLVVLAAVHRDDTEATVRKCADRIAGLRIFNDEAGKMNLAIPASTGLPQILAISNFTVLGDAMKSRRPSFTDSAGYEQGKALFENFVKALREAGLLVDTGIFGADMQVELVNDGPVTLVIET